MRVKSTLTAFAAVAIMGCISDGPIVEPLYVDASGPGLEDGFSHYLIHGEVPSNFSIEVFLAESHRYGELQFSIDQDSTSIEIAVDETGESRSIVMAHGELVVSERGSEIVRMLDGERVAGELRGSDYVFARLLATTSDDLLLQSALRVADVDEEKAVCAPLAPDIAGETGVGGPPAEAKLKCSYGGCVARILLAEAALVAAVAFAPVCAGACLTIAGCAICIAGYGAGSFVGYQAICSACWNGCVPGCENVDWR